MAMAALADVALAGAMVWAVVRRRPLAVPLSLLLFTLLPTLVVDVVRGYMLYAERFFYLPSAGAALLLALALARTRAGARVAVAGAGVALVAASAVAAWQTLPAWSSDLAQFSQQAERAPDNYQAHVQLARQLLDAGRDDQAGRELDAAAALDAGRPEAMSVRAALAFRRGQWPAALAQARAALAHGDARPEPALIAATALLALGRATEAKGLVDTLEGRAPDLPAVVSLYGQWLLATGHPAEAEPALDRALAFDSGNADLAYMTGVAHEQARHFPAAREAFRHALALDPAHYDAWLGVARASAALGDRAAAGAALERAAALPQARDGRAATLRGQLNAQWGSPPAAPGHP
jgi:tetratricopeptide (TPR) repeat protein